MAIQNGGKKDTLPSYRLRRRFWDTTKTASLGGAGVKEEEGRLAGEIRSLFICLYPCIGGLAGFMAAASKSNRVACAETRSSWQIPRSIKSVYSPLD